MLLTGDYIENALMTPKMKFNLTRANTYRKVVHNGNEMELINFHSALYFDDSDLFYVSPTTINSIGAAHPSAISVNK